jgi:hypothetical protein
MPRVSTHQSYLLLLAQFVVLYYLTRKPLLFYKDLSILDFLADSQVVFKCTEEGLRKFGFRNLILVMIRIKVFFGVLKLPFNNFAYDENRKGAA